MIPLWIYFGTVLPLIACCGWLSHQLSKAREPQVRYRNGAVVVEYVHDVPEDWEPPKMGLS